jgi:hypothetical protein
LREGGPVQVELVAPTRVQLFDDTRCKRFIESGEHVFLGNVLDQPAQQHEAELRADDRRHRENALCVDRHPVDAGLDEPTDAVRDAERCAGGVGSSAELVVSSPSASR